MSNISFALDVITLGYIYNEKLEYLVVKHGITMEEANDVLIKIGFSQGCNIKTIT